MLKRLISAMLVLCMLLTSVGVFAEETEPSAPAVETVREEKSEPEQKAPAAKEETPEKEPEKEPDKEPAEEKPAEAPAEEPEQEIEAETPVTEPAEEPDEVSEEEIPEAPEQEEEEETEEVVEEIPVLMEGEEPAETEETTTDPVDDSTTLPDGEYTPESFSFTGGTGKTTITCEKVIVSGGKAKAVIVISSTAYTTLKAGGKVFNTVKGEESRYTIPIDLNVANRILATTEAMTEPHEIEYMITVTLDETVPEQEETEETTTDPVDDSTTLPDGEYTPDDFSFTGGTGKTTFTCEKVIVSGGKAQAVIVISSNAYTTLKAGGQVFSTVKGEESRYIIPIDLNVANRILATTEAMTEPHEIEYMITVTLDETVPEDPEEPEEEFEDGEYVLDIDSTFSMFKVTSRKIVVSGNVITVTIGTSKDTYDKIHIGSKDDEDLETNYIQGVKHEGELGYDFTFVLDKKWMGKSIDFVPGKPDGTWYVKNQYQLTIPAADTMEKKIEDGEYVLDIDSTFSMFKVTSRKIVVSGNVITVTIGTSKDTYDKIHIGSKDDEDLETNYIQGVKHEDELGYDFTFVLDKKWMGKSIDFVPGKPDGTWYVKNQYQLTIPAMDAMEKKIEDGDYEFGVTSTFSMFAVTSAKAVVSGNVITVTIATSKNTYDKIHIGNKDDEDLETNFIEGVKREDGDGYIFTFVLDKSWMGKAIDFVPCKPDGTWYVKNQYQLNIPEALGEKIEPEEDPEPITYDDGTYTTPVDAWIGMKFKNAQITVEGDIAHIVLHSAQTNYTKLYIGDSTDTAVMDAEAIVGVFNENYTAVTFTFDLPVSMLGTKLNAAFYGTQTFSPKWDIREITFDANLTASEPEKEIDINDYADGEYEAETGSYVQKIDGDITRYSAGGLSIGSTTVKVVGDQIVVTIYGVSATKLSYDKLFIGSTADAEAGAEGIWAEADTTDSSEAGMNFVTPVYTFTLPKSALGTLIPVALHKTSDGTYFQSYIEIGKALVAKDQPDPEDPTDPDPEPQPVELEDGDYEIAVETGENMFKVVACKLFVKNGKMMALITLSGTGYDYLFAGTKAEAEAADPSAYIPYTVNAEGKYTYLFPVSAVGVPIPAASRSAKYQAWYDRTLTFKADSAAPVEHTEHLPGEPVYENEIPATREEDGTRDEVIRCTVCGEELSRKSVTIPAEGWPTFDLAASKNPTQKVNIGEKLNLTVNYATEKGLTVTGWKTSSSKIAKVDKLTGVVTGVAEGTATITATLSNKKTTTVKVTVVDPLKPTKVTLNVTGTKTLAMAERLEDNETLQLIPTITPATADTEATVISWKSSDKKIAVVENGLVTPKGIGTATITVTAKYKVGKKTTTKTATMKVKVTDPYKPGKVKLNLTGTQPLEMGKNYTDNTLQLIPTIVAADANCTAENIEAAYTWKSSSKKIAVVENGMIIPKGAGTATITVTAKRGKITKTATMKVKVTDPFKPTGVKLNVEGLVMLSMGQALADNVTCQLVPELLPVDAEADYSWKSSDTKTVQVKDGLVMPVGAGTATVTVTAKRGSVTKTASIKVTVDDPFKITGTKINPVESNIVKVKETLALSASVAPDNDTEVTYTWKSSDKKIAKVDAAGVVTGVKAGTATITVTAKRGKITKTATMKVKVVK